MKTEEITGRFVEILNSRMTYIGSFLDESHQGEFIVTWRPGGSRDCKDAKDSIADLMEVYKDLFGEELK